MKKTFSYPELWREKQRELPPKGNPHTEWLKMRAVLDQRMPAAGIVKKTNRLKLPKWGLKVLVGVSAAAALYMAGRLYLAKTHHEAAKPIELQHRRDSLPSPVKSIIPAANTAAPVTPAAAPLLVPPMKPDNDTSMQHKARANQSVNRPPALNTPVHRDSVIVPVEAAPLKLPGDSTGTVDLKKKDIQKDTSSNNKKNPKKKRRSKVSVFF